MTKFSVFVEVYPDAGALPPAIDGYLGLKYSQSTYIITGFNWSLGSLNTFRQYTLLR